MALRFSSYSRPTFVGTVKLTEESGMQAIRLPIPSQLVDSIDVHYDESKQYHPIAEAMWATQSGSEGASAAGERLISRIAQYGLVPALKDLLKDVKLFNVDKLGNAAQDVIDTIFQGYGYADNPMLTVSLTSPSFRKHDFTWRVSPNSPEESQTIAVIIDQLKFASLPSIAAGWYQYPSIVMPQIFPSEKYLYRFQPCVITNVTSNYAPSGVSAWYRGGDGAPVDIEFRIQLLEIILNTRQTFR